MKEKIMPSFVLTLICVITAGLLSIAYHATYTDTSGTMTDELKSACTEIFGAADYSIIMTEDEDGESVAAAYGKANAVIIGKEGQYLFEVTVDGYEKSGITLLIGVEDNSVAGIYPLSINETPGLGTKIQDQDFLTQFNGVKQTQDMDVIDSITSATLSSNGVKNAVTIALEAYNLVILE